MNDNFNSAEDPAQQKDTMSDNDRFELIAGDISDNKPLNETAYKALLLEIEQRRKISASERHLKTVEDTATDVAEGAQLTLLDINTVGQIETIEHVAKSLEASLNILGPIGFFIANGVGLLTTPWRCYKEKRWPTRDEGIKLGLCVAAIALVAVAMTVPLVAVGAFIAVGAITLVKSIQNIRIKKIELHHALDKAREKHAAIKELNIKIGELQESTQPDKEEAIKNLNKQLTQLTDDYVQYGHIIHGLKQELHDPFISSLNYVNVAMSAVALIAVIVVIFSPPIGLGLLLGAGLISLATVGISAASKWFTHRKERPSAASMTPEPKVPVEKPIQPNESPSPAESVTNVLRPAQDLNVDCKQKPELGTILQPIIVTWVSIAAAAVTLVRSIQSILLGAGLTKLATLGISAAMKSFANHQPVASIAPRPGSQALELNISDEQPVKSQDQPQAVVPQSAPKSSPSIDHFEEVDRELKSELRTILESQVSKKNDDEGEESDHNYGAKEE